MRVLPSSGDVRDAAVRLAPFVERTPLRRSEPLSTFLGGDVFLKLECLQLTGSFKIRGATNALAELSSDVRRRGVVTASAGNHGLGLAAAAHALDVHATVFLPAGASALKRSRIAALGATIDDSATNYDHAELLARAHAVRTGATFVSPCTGKELLAGQGTVALEILEELPSLSTIVASVGGGGLIGGIAAFIRAESPGVRIIGAQTEHTNAMALALASRLPTDIPDLPTLADGLKGRVDADMLAQGQASLDSIAVVSESQLEQSIAFLWIEESLKVEGAGAAGVAAALSGELHGGSTSTPRRPLRQTPAPFAPTSPDERAPVEFPLVIVVSGGNIDDETLHAIVNARP